MQTKTKTIPVAAGIISYDAFDRDIRNERDCTTKNSPGKHFKQPPFADQIFKRSRLWHVRVGLDAFELAAKDYKNADPRYPISVFALPWGENPFDFNWPVQGQTLDILSAGKHSELVRELGDALHHCGALDVYGRADGDILHWHNDQLEAA